ncbi:zinc finger BED domain-containing protein RICESLEEPER 2-like [Phoenix dactylifera]|uniref:Zinc finger BED domain-containing protein RICESLEEPER 2-like n=1 Tax=Phoenix dactylifera TaxID=42345 RepID=A0A8B7BHH6_PHODC|nr:zinc finger BED domain-containing protein RICESLEEPER 2-like [Phoenix dactylifera]XP_008776871.1 zinc finger BED domain-containing protein RICESLEEPER 2-like [Phoenix dactylifera]XP_008776872.1 zinc finger BED domain-containing protein RICESLEEPER 2-like [Phoenix dactylifera]XP_008776873.1 zinc finger BED domain-containing protein RICESLEEPER 2-like [Phoenix dactylifera]XP_038976159.1 zinc finger BED domain-containing protein RICESLEEPER 2-like [Phoenix dactylifera]XP_038976160.1 zinc finge
MAGASDTEPVSPETTTPQPSRRRRKKSLVWEHFTIEAVSGGCTRACCKLCKQTFAYSSGSKIAGTSHLKRHIALGSCPKIKNQEKKQLALTSGSKIDDTSSEPPPKRRYRISGFANAAFDQDVSCVYLAKMIIVHDYPLHMVEHPAFISFIQSLQPRFKMVDFNSIEAEILAIYHKEKQNLMQVFGTMPGRVSLTIGLWTTSQTLGYVCLTGQFIDSDWRLHRRMLNFMMVSSPHSENALSEVIGVSLSDWNMKSKLFTITLDNNCSSHDIYSANLRDHLSNKNTLMLKGQLFVVRCYAHILNVVAQDVIASIHGIIYNIRESVKFVKASLAREEKFAEIALQLEIPSTKTLSLDVTTQWNTTYLLLVAALEYKQAFTVLETCDDNYNEAPSTEDWKKVEIVCTYLKLLYDSANVIMATADPTANIFFHEAWKIQLELATATMNEDVLVSSIAKEMHEKFDKYWKDCSLVLAIAVVMDPRFKMKLVEFSFSKIYGADAARYVKVVDDSIHELYLEYVAQPLPLTPAYEEQGEATTNNINGNDSCRPATPASTGDGLLDFDLYLSEMAVNQPTKSELDQYLEESLVPRIQEFDILNWWKLNNLKYPTLSKMARDILAIPMSMVSTGSSIFASGTGSRVLDEYRSSLRPETVEALFCAKDWLQYLPTMAEPPSTAIVKMEM